MELETETMEVTHEERDLIETIRNYNRSYPNGHPQLLDYATALFQELTYHP